MKDFEIGFHHRTKKLLNLKVQSEMSEKFKNAGTKNIPRLRAIQLRTSLLCSFFFVSE